MSGINIPPPITNVEDDRRARHVRYAEQQLSKGLALRIDVRARDAYWFPTNGRGRYHMSYRQAVAVAEWAKGAYLVDALGNPPGSILVVRPTLLKPFGAESGVHSGDGIASVEPAAPPAGVEIEATTPVARRPRLVLTQPYYSAPELRDLLDHGRGAMTVQPSTLRRAGMEPVSRPSITGRRCLTVLTDERLVAWLEERGYDVEIRVEDRKLNEEE